MKHSAWKWLAEKLVAAGVWCWRRQCGPLGGLPDGIPGIRDTDSKCSGFEPRQPLPGDYRDCEGDGHYLCWECAHHVEDDAS